MSDATTDAPAITPAALKLVLSHCLFRLGGAASSAHSAGESLAHAARRLDGRGLSERGRKGLDDAAQVIAHATEQLARAAAILDRVAHGDPDPVPAREPAGPGSYYDFAGYAAPELGGEGG